MQRHAILMVDVEKEQKRLKLQVLKLNTSKKNYCIGSYSAYVYCSANNRCELGNLVVF